ncbi:MAG: hypothetical protein G01um101418_134 [Parcubacteria group bacterium Gr01-1014_18]|nr:MAG: hypothetical protein Greene041636_438 [Parcubacteria group bacterium Greene0416_36]TSC81461.1 MAG: hypothetical protein G01um101418_134 [Parcubacteria group bacterium Gr01-1014_18]TSC99059.1 MAG: hypothetical protein Greene101420_415 [Parcubacteria group bacterium Greene1014_20]TSD07260.1 MAG: hypothetical protein Greene07142_276 [Parcubacteria group bacterium Greene0714_2]
MLTKFRFHPSICSYRRQQAWCAETRKGEGDEYHISPAEAYSYHFRIIAGRNMDLPHFLKVDYGMVINHIFLFLWQKVNKPKPKPWKL